MANTEKNNEVELDWGDPKEKGSISEGIKKWASTGLSVMMMSEEMIKQYLSEVKVPKEAFGSVLKGVQKSREDLVKRAGDEVARLIEKVDVVEEVTTFLRQNKIKASFEVEFLKKDASEKDEPSS